MNFFQLEYFVMAVEKSSFAEVASAMHVTQPTITYQIGNLEDELGEAQWQDRQVSFTLKPYEIRTFKIKWQG